MPLRRKGIVRMKENDEPKQETIDKPLVLFRK